MERNEKVCGGAARVIEIMGGHKKVAEILGYKSLSPIYKFTYPRDKNGLGGFIPMDQAQKLLDHAKAHNIELRPDHFFDPAPSSAEAENPPDQVAEEI